LFNVPVICSDNPVFKEITDDCVMYFQPKQIDSMSNAMKVALRDKELTGSCVRKGALKVADFSTRKMAQDTLQVYRSVL
jgi:glycosyltransferase involved in cell wall biosynthesis